MADLKFEVEVFETMGAADSNVGFFAHPTINRYVLQRKYDGTRAMLHKKGNVVTIPGRSWKSNYAENPLYRDIIKEALSIPVDEFVLDGELTFFTTDGTDKVRTALSTEVEVLKEGLTPRYMVFDVISVIGQSARNYPYTKRYEMVKMLLGSTPRTAIQIVEMHTDSTAFRNVFEGIIAQGGEGVVLKPADSRYVNWNKGIWLKVKKSYTEDCAVIGMTIGEGSRAGMFGSLVLAQVVNGRYRYVGKVGTGLNAEKIARLYKAIMETPEAERNEYGDIPVKEIQRLVKPKLVAEVKYLNRTENGILRMPVFVRERDDKTAEMCVMR